MLVVLCACGRGGRGGGQQGEGVVIREGWGRGREAETGNVHVYGGLCVDCG